MSNEFIEVPVIRGITEIAPLLELAQATGAVICGGYARFCCSQVVDPVKAGDVDVFPGPNTDSLDRLTAELQRIGFTTEYENEIAITLKAPTGDGADQLWQYRPQIQIIKRKHEERMNTEGTLQDLLKRFDFTVVRIGLLNTTTALADKDFIEHERQKVLHIENIVCPISSLLRCMKYGRKGYFIKPSEAVKLFAEWTERGEEYRSNILELFKASAFGEMTQDQVDRLEALLWVD